MALGHIGVRSVAQATSDLTSYRNDAFSFWKLPDVYQSHLSHSIDISEKQAERLLFEQYLAAGSSSHSRNGRSDRNANDLLARSIDSLGIHRRTARLDFPRWPCESALGDFWTSWLRNSLEIMNADDTWHIAFWPGAATCAIALTHDIEDMGSLGHIEYIADLEEKYGFRSAFYVPTSYLSPDWRRVEALQSRGFEFGVRLTDRDGKAFRSVAPFLDARSEVDAVAKERQLYGSRMRAGERRVSWLNKLPFGFDSTLFDTDPYAAHPGGSCSLFPFFLRHQVELPKTLPSDYTLIHLLRRNPLATWALKAQWIARAGGMILSANDAKYFGVDSYVAAYEELLRLLSDFDGAWRTVPSMLAGWWTCRASSTLIMRQSEPIVSNCPLSSASPKRISDEPIMQ